MLTESFWHIVSAGRLRPLEKAFRQVEGAWLDVTVVRSAGPWAGSPQRLVHAETIVITPRLQRRK